ncbi:hypothetical protein G9A89_013971 [Geosiphon pyriformis]|nr:hypothetical protein G9A89_013971 [Geosiphon pyriformis]
MQLFDFSPPLVAYTLLGGFIVLYALVSLILKEKLYISEALVATLMGLIIGPACLNLVDPTQWEQKDGFTMELTRVVLAIQVMTAAVNLPRTYIKRHALSMFIMLFPVMLFMWLVSGTIIYLFISDAKLTEALLIAACVTPTDPILANSVVQGSFAEKHIPTQIRHLLSAESGANDGMGYPFLYFALFLLQSPQDTLSAIRKWVYIVWGYDILFSVIIGFAIGWTARKLLRMAESRDWIDKESFLSFSFALAIFVLGAVSMLGSDALLACFVAGTLFSWDDWFRQETQDAHLQDVIDLLLNLTIFIYIGAILPWSSFQSESLSLKHLIPMSFLILIFRRLPAVVGLMKFIPAIRTFKEAVFAGYFGPIGVGAIFLAMTVQNEIEKTFWEYPKNSVDEEGLARTRELVFPIVAFIVLSSVIVHGITIPILNIGSHIDIERFPSIASISNQVARLPVIDFVESLTLERDSSGKVNRKEKMKAEILRSPMRIEKPIAEEDVQRTEIFEEVGTDEDAYSSQNKVETDILIEIEDDPNQESYFLPKTEAAGKPSLNGEESSKGSHPHSLHVSYEE